MNDDVTISTLRAALAASEAKVTVAQAMASAAQAKVSDAEAHIAHLKLTIEKLQRELYGVRACSHHVNSQPTALKKFRHSCGLNIWQTSPIAFQTSSKVLAPALLR